MVVEHHYASNETHTVAWVDRYGIGYVNPGVEVRVGDERGKPVSSGSQGLIGARTPFMVGGYLWDDEATALGFHDGWYRSNDLGRLVAPDRLVLLGRPMRW